MSKMKRFVTDLENLITALSNDLSDVLKTFLERLTVIMRQVADEDPRIKQNSNRRVLSKENIDPEVAAIDTSCSETLSLDDGDQENRALNITENGHAKVRKVSLENDTGTPTPKKRHCKRKAENELKTTKMRFTDVAVQQKTADVIDYERKLLEKEENLHKREMLTQAKIEKRRRKCQQTLEKLERKKKKVLELRKLNEERYRQKQAKEEAKRKRLQTKLRAQEEMMKNEKQRQKVLSQNMARKDQEIEKTLKSRENIATLIEMEARAPSLPTQECSVSAKEVEVNVEQPRRRTFPFAYTIPCEKRIGRDMFLRSGIIDSERGTRNVAVLPPFTSTDKYQETSENSDDTDTIIISDDSSEAPLERNTD